MSTPEIRLRQFGQALSRFEEGLALPVDPVVRDACIQRFEFTFETAWKAIQVDASAEGLECTAPRDCMPDPSQGFRLHCGAPRPFSLTRYFTATGPRPRCLGTFAAWAIAILPSIAR